MGYIVQFIAIAGIHLLAVASPGPDFALIVKNSVTQSRRVGIYSALGIALGILVHVSYSLVGLGVVISQSVVAFSVVKFAGAAYLIFIGLKALRAKRTEAMAEVTQPHKVIMTPGQAVRNGFLTNVLNPKATLYFLSLFTQVIDPATPLWVQGVFATEMWVITFAWFSVLAVGLSHRLVLERFQRVQHWVERATGAVLIALGIKLATSSAK